VISTIPKRLVSEAVGTALPLAAVVGSGIMARRRAGGNVAFALLANTVGTGAALVALILTCGPISGAQSPSKRNPSKIFRVLRPTLLEQLLAGVPEPQRDRPMKA
jgi:glycerol uptake facilitator-like aquaporin